MFCPIHQAGSETTVHAVLRAMVERGHEVSVVADQMTPSKIQEMAGRSPEGFKVLSPTSYEYHGVKVLSLPQQGHQFGLIKEYAANADLLVTHLDCTSLAMQLHLDTQIPLVHWVHNHMQLNFHSVIPHKAQLVIFNSRWVADKQRFTDPISRKEQPWSGESIVMWPNIEPEKYKCERGNKITLCNPTDGKGIATLHKLAESMPDYEFLVVEGIYGEQIAPPNLGEEWERAHPNIEHMKNDPDFRNVLRKTRVLLMPSNYESYGRCAVEAACAGIPSIVHPTEGLLESLGAERIPTDEELEGGWVSGAGIYCDRADIPSWKAQIERLYSDEVYYRARSDAALKLANSLQPEAEFDRVERALIKTVNDWRKKNEVKNMTMWGPSDRRYWETSEGKLVAEIDGRIPSNATRLAIGIGGYIPEEVAIANGMMEAKAIEQPAENKAHEAPTENKSKRGKKKAEAA